MLKNWTLQGLRQNGIKYESAAEEKNSGGVINKLGHTHIVVSQVIA